MSFYDHFSEEEVAILRARAARIARTQNEVKPGEILTALVIHAGGETYALPIEALVAVYVEHTIIQVPCVPPYVAGVANIRGQILTVLDLAVLLKVSSGTTPHALVVASDGEFSVAFCAEAVGETITLPNSDLQPVPAALNGDYLQAVVPGGIALLNLKALFDDEALTVDETVGQ